MEEVDGIILHNLRDVGCDIEEDVVSLGVLSVEMVCEAAGRCLAAINPELNISYRLPPSMAARFRIGTDLATAVKDVGFKGDIGYHTFLYSNEIEIRRVLMYLVDRLPKEHAQDSNAQAAGSQALLGKKIADVMSKHLATAWILPAIRPKRRNALLPPHRWQSCHLSVPVGLLDTAHPPTKDRVKHYRSTQLYLYDQKHSSADVWASVLESNAVWFGRQREWDNEWSQHGLSSCVNAQEYGERKRQRIREKISDQLKQCIDSSQLEARSHDLNQKMNEAESIKGSRFSRLEKLQFARDDDTIISQVGTVAPPTDRSSSDKDEQTERAMKLQGLSERLTELSNTYDQLGADVRKYNTSISQMKEQLKACERENTDKKREHEMKKQTIDILPSAETHISQLKSAIESSQQRLVSFTNQWDKHRMPLEERLKELKELSAGRILETQKKLEEMRDMQERQRELTLESREKEEFCKQLEVEYERMTKDVNRTAYTRRILEIVANIRKQNQDIDKVLIDTKDVQKEINSLSGKLDRTFVVTDELIFKDAKRDEAARKAYKYLAALHENCDILVKTIEETGAITREIRDFEDLVESESKKRTDDTLEQILSDYQLMKRENSELSSRLKQMS